MHYLALRCRCPCVKVVFNWRKVASADMEWTELARTVSWYFVIALLKKGVLILQIWWVIKMNTCTLYATGILVCTRPVFLISLTLGFLYQLGKA